MANAKTVEIIAALIQTEGSTQLLESFVEATSNILDYAEGVPEEEWGSPKSKQSFFDKWQLVHSNLKNTVDTLENRMNRK